MKKILIIIAMLPFLSGCGTFVARTGWRNECSGIPRYYPATVVDAQIIAAPFNLDAELSSLPRRLFGCLVGIVDLPISLVTDTVCIPLDIWSYEPRQ